ncbi:MAG: PAS domain S-box protein, partial [Symploca sp. SIO3E6]|nr:PAS domain S-box protein [Caldora sp. SIO3E6]
MTSKILVVDNQPNNLRVLSNMLTQEGYKVQRAISGQLALNAAVAAPPDLILLDVIMPVMDGYEVCQRLKAIPVTQNIPIIFLSALQETADKVRALKVGGVDFITKPFQVEEVLARIENQLTIQKLQQQCTNQNSRLRQEIEERVVAQLKLQRIQRKLSALTSELKVEKERFELVVQASNNGFWDWNLESGELYLSPRWKEMLGYTDEELPNTIATWENLIFPADKEAAYKLATAYNTGTVSGFESKQRFHHKNGSTVHVLSRGIHLKNEAGKVVRMIGAHINITETIHTLKTLQESQSLLEGVLHSSLDGIMGFAAIRNNQGQIIDFRWLLLNQAAETMVGRTAGELAGKQLLLEMPGNRETGLFSLYVSVVETGRPQEKELYYEHEGIEAYLQIVAVKLGDGFTVTVRDITQRKQAEERLKLLERAVATSSNGILISDAQAPDNPIIYVNSGFERITGYSAEEVIGKNCRFLQGRDKQQPTLKKLRSVIAQGREGQFILCNYRKDGKLFWNEFSITPVRDETGKLTNYIGIQSDITERITAEQALRESEARFRAMADSTSVLMWVSGISGQYTFFNKTWLEFTGHSLEEELGSGWLRNVHPQDQQRYLESFLTALEHQNNFELEYRLLHVDGEYRWIFGSGKPRFTPDGSFAGYIGSGFDITKRKQAELELENAQAVMERQIQRSLLLHQITQEIRSSLKPEEIFQTAATQIGQAFQVNSCLIHTYRSLPPGVIGVAEYKQPGVKSIQRVEFPLQNNPHAQMVLDQDQVVVSHDVYADPLLVRFSRLFYRCGIKSMLSVRTSYQGKPNGMISIHQCDRFRYWKEEEIELLELVAHQMGIAIAQANLLEQEKQRRRELDRQNQQLQQEIRERQLIEEALRKSEERWQLALSGTGDGIWDWDITTNEAFMSVRWKEMLGYKDHEIANNKDEWHSRIHPEDLAWVMDALQAHLARVTPHYVAEHRLQCKNGSYRWFLARGQGQWDETGKPVRLLGSITDITEGKLAGEALQHRANRDSLLSSISRQFLDRDLDSAINFTLQAIGEFLGSDRCYICQYQKHQSQFTMTYEWYGEGIEPSIAYYQKVQIKNFPWLYRQFTNHHLINIPLVAELSVAA